MARQESEVPLEQRFVLIKGIVSMSICEKVYTNFTLRIDEKKVCCFMSFAYADLPKGKRFDLVFSKLKPEKHIDTSMRWQLLHRNLVRNGSSFRMDGRQFVSWIFRTGSRN